MEDHDTIADQGEHDADQMDELSGRLKRDIDETRDDWERKKKAEGVPGAIETEDELQAKKEDSADDPNEFELEKRTPETAEAKGPQGLDSDDGDNSSDDDS